MRKTVLLAAACLFTPLAIAAADEGAAAPLDWQHWQAGNEVSNTASLQRGARNFFGYCAGCHSLKYLRYSRLASDLRISPDQLKADLLPAGATPADYVKSSLAADDAVAWFGKVPPDLSLIARARGPNHVYQFLKTFYADPSTPTHSNNLALVNPAMPAVLSDLEGVKEAVFRNVEVTVDGSVTTEKRFDHFVTTVPGRLNAAQFDGFVRDTVNFLDYVGEPAQVERRSIGVWVVLFLLVFTWIALLLKKEYWKDVH
ncbi:MAG: cytochrome c1 [Gammaproteobacteria bacterium]|nr:cytochrome c1 [Gammaproteobacteria bacterium]MDE2251643.1 cytochrome c1 [Gammaproteobacteria bacterium]